MQAQAHTHTVYIGYCIVVVNCTMHECGTEKTQCTVLWWNIKMQCKIRVFKNDELITNYKHTHTATYTFTSTPHNVRNHARILCEWISGIDDDDAWYRMWNNSLQLCVFFFLLQYQIIWLFIIYMCVLCSVRTTVRVYANVQ